MHLQIKLYIYILNRGNPMIKMDSGASLRIFLPLMFSVLQVLAAAKIRVLYHNRGVAWAK